MRIIVVQPKIKIVTWGIVTYCQNAVIRSFMNSNNAWTEPGCPTSEERRPEVNLRRSRRLRAIQSPAVNVTHAVLHDDIM